MTLKNTLRCCAVLPLFLLPVALLAQGTKLWEQSKYDELQKGTAKDVAIRRNGGLELAPSLTPLYASPSTQIWTIASDDAGNLYAGAGSPARVYRITADGKASIVFESKDLQVQAIAVDKAGAIFAATLPDSKVYKIVKGSGTAAVAATPAKTTDAGNATNAAANPEDAKPPVDATYSSSVFFDPKTRYIWAMLFDATGNLFVATGDNGEIFRVTPKGDSKVFFKSDDAHIRSLALDGTGNLIAGSDGSGLIYRISTSGEGLVLYGASKKEITALAVDKAGNIYAAAVGEKRSSGGLAQALAQQPVTITVTGNQHVGPIGASPLPQNAGPLPLPAFGAAGGSDLIRIATDGSPERIWNSNDEIAYALAFDPNGRLLVGTGNKGRIFAVNATLTGDDDYADLGRANASQVTAFAPAPNGGLFLATSNLGKVFKLGPALAAEGSYESDVFDARIFSRWGRTELRGNNVQLFARSGNVDNPDRNWSLWSKVELGGDAKVQAPPARYLQWKAILKPGSGHSELNTVAVNYRTKNVAPVVEDVTVQVGARVTASSRPTGQSFLLSANSQSSSSDRFESPVPTIRDRDSIAVKWNARDANDDQLSFAVYYRSEGDSRWQLLRDDLSDHWLSFEAALLPDGTYTVRVVASDADSHTPGEGLTGEKASQRFQVDTTAPRIEELKAAAAASGIHVTFHASDASVIKQAEYSIDAGDWQFLEPVGELADSKNASYDFVAPLPKPLSDKTQAGDEHVVVVRVFDRYDNAVTAKIVLNVPNAAASKR